MQNDSTNKYYCGGEHQWTKDCTHWVHRVPFWYVKIKVGTLFLFHGIYYGRSALWIVSEMSALYDIAVTFERKEILSAVKKQNAY
jgi:hypothetical protein